MRQGVDVIFGCGSVTGNGAITAAAKPRCSRLVWIPINIWTLPDAAPRMLSSAIKLITPGVYELIKLSRDGNFPSGNLFGNVGYAPFHDLENKVPVEVKIKWKRSMPVYWTARSKPMCHPKNHKTKFVQ